MGVVLGVGIFRSPSVVAANAGGPGAFVILWLVGGAVSLAGALCYAELATAFPDTGGEYSIVSRAYGDEVGFFVAWARMAVIQTGAIGIQSYVFADFSRGLPVVGDVPPVALAASAVIVLTALNVAGLKPGKITQYVLTAGAALTLAAVIGAGFATDGPAAAPPTAEPAASGGGSIGLALVFVLLAFGGWNEGAYVSAEVEDRKRGAKRALIWGTGAITVLYVLANVAYLRGLGIDGVAGSSAVAADLIEAVVGPAGSYVVRFAIILAALSSANAILMTGARSTYALGRDWAFFRILGSWGAERQTPTPALLLHGAIALLLVLFGALQRSGFEAAVAYTAPVYWLTLLLTGGAVIVLRRKEPDVERG
ncbi:MAG TPA: amino acid permease, partial [Longimicrobiales bacterium]|nr:amino acid permease [Longimicrobiales bacterium]